MFHLDTVYCYVPSGCSILLFHVDTVYYYVPSGYGILLCSRAHNIIVTTSIL